MHNIISNCGVPILPRRRGVAHAFVLSMFLALLAGCQHSAVSPVPESLIMDVTFWKTTGGGGELAPYIYPGNPVKYPSHRCTEEEQRMLRQMIKDNWEYHVKYRGNHAIAVVDLSKTGFIEWWNVNKSHFPVDFKLARRNKRFFAFMFREGRWWFEGDGVPRGWSGFDEERKEWETLNLPDLE